MKTFSLLCPVFAICGVGFASAFAQSNPSRAAPGDPRPNSTLLANPNQAGAEPNKLEVASPEAVERGVRKLAGKPVQGANGEKLGTIRDFVIDKKTGQVVYAVVASGGLRARRTRERCHRPRSGCLDSLGTTRPQRSSRRRDHPTQPR